MLEAVRGTVEQASDGVLHLNLGPITLEFLIPAYFQGQLIPDREVRVYTHFQLVNEGSRTVALAVAFPCVRDRWFFRNFISVSGVGIRAAARALCHPPEDVAAAIASGDHNFLKSLPGIGAARAKQIVAKLQDSMSSAGSGLPGEAPCSGSRSEALLVLRQLGVPAEQASNLVSRAAQEAGETAETQDLIRVAMRIRSGG